ncbi:LPS export ABC transporter permease LptG [Neisseria sp. Ec49-e6-T10]|uniref:LPS export ABC transporter permease LptG n=1 Tax=Neisseria sp. Ec49-e6-T10 TaxID=3140744 RepID=UPI003EB9C3AC
MKIISRYLAKQLILISLFTLVALLGLYAFFDITEEVSKIGQGHYNTWVMLGYIALTLPSHAYELMPLAVLIGAMITMSQLANHSEYTVIRTSGISIMQVGGMLLRFGLLFALLAILFGEVIAPYTQEKAEKMRLRAINSEVAEQNFKTGIWVKDNNHFINIAKMMPDNTLEGIKVYRYNDTKEHTMSQSLFASSATYINKGVWRLKDVRLTKLEGNKTVVEHYDELEWKSILEPKILNVLLVVPEQMASLNLVYYINHLKNNQQQTKRYEIALWSKLFYPLACVSMALIALAFTPKQRRQGALGIRLFFGICLGVAFHFIDRFFGYLGLLHAWNPIITATLPTLLFLVMGLMVIIRQEYR